MSEANPYSAPDAALGTGMGAETYEPTIFSFHGRIGRMRYLAYGMGIMALFMIMIGILSAVLIPVVAGGGNFMGMVSGLLLLILYVPAIVFMIMFGKRRLNDLNRSGWWILLSLVPIVNIALSIYMLFFPGTDGSNHFGPAPVANSTGVLILGWIVIVLFVLFIVGSIAAPILMGLA